jgi:hypothetical protein
LLETIKIRLFPEDIITIQYRIKKHTRKLFTEFEHSGEPHYTAPPHNLPPAGNRYWMNKNKLK